MLTSKHPNQQLTGKESEILWILWGSDKPLIASEIVKLQEGLSINTVQTVLRSLMKKGLIEIAEIVYSGTVLCRSYRTTPLSAQYKIDRFTEQYQSLTKKISPTSIFAALVESEGNEAEVVKVLEAILDQKTREMPKA